MTKIFNIETFLYIKIHIANDIVILNENKIRRIMRIHTISYPKTLREIRRIKYDLDIC